MQNKINLMNDYNIAAHPRVLDALNAAADNRYIGYGLDEECEAAASMVKALIDRPDAEVHFMPGGTVTNMTAIGAFLRPHEAAIAPATAHINVHETGAIEAVGHKILTVMTGDGKIRPDDVDEVCEGQTDEHMSKPRLLYISQTTECGTVYSRAEFFALRDVCDRRGLLLYVDGARLGYAVTAPGSDLHMEAIADKADAFYIGGTKNGALFGEALVICNESLQGDARYHIKQRGGLMAKGFLLGIQFKALFQNGLYFALASKANEMAEELRAALKGLGYDFEVDSPSNQVFPVISEGAAARLEEEILFERWHKLGGGNVSIRFVTTWATTAEEIEAVVRLMGRPDVVRSK